MKPRPPAGVRHLVPVWLVGTLFALAGCAPGSAVSPPSPTAPAQTSATSTPPLTTGAAASTVPAVTAKPTAGPYSPAPAGDFASDLVEGLEVEVDQPFTDTIACGLGPCRIPLDILAPEGGASLPTFVLVPGGPARFADRRYMDLLATGLAQRGAVVFLTTYRSRITNDDDAAALLDIRCAIRFARAHTTDHGGDPGRVVLVGHSYSSPLVIETGGIAEQPTPGCSSDADGVPGAIVALSLFDPTPALGTPNPLPFILACGSADTCSADGAAAALFLKSAGFTAEYREFEGIDHFGMVTPDTAGLLDMLFEAADLAGG